MLIFLIWFLASLALGRLGRDRAFGFWGFFLASMFLSPVFVLLVLLLTDREPRARCGDD